MMVVEKKQRSKVFIDISSENKEKKRVVIELLVNTLWNCLLLG